MDAKAISIFVDESGSFTYPDEMSPYYLVGLICTVSLIARKIELGYPLTNSEHKFFGGPREFTRNILRSIKRKEM